MRTVKFKLFDRMQEIDEKDTKALYGVIIEKLMPHESRMSPWDFGELKELIDLLVAACVSEGHKDVNNAFFENQDN